MNKKMIGSLLISIGILLICFIIFNIFVNNSDALVSPIPHQNGVKVIYVTPEKK